MLFQYASKVIAGKLAALVGVEYLWCSVSLYRLLKRFSTKAGIQGI